MHVEVKVKLQDMWEVQEQQEIQEKQEEQDKQEKQEKQQEICGKSRRRVISGWFPLNSRQEASLYLPELLLIMTHPQKVVFNINTLFVITALCTFALKNINFPFMTGFQIIFVFKSNCACQISIFYCNKSCSITIVAICG